ncbi:MAG: lipocalin family protein [Chitinophagaceae bacterium]|nr:lipocalin family protein [Chitinophagaceae bacterium]
MKNTTILKIALSFILFAAVSQSCKKESKQKTKTDLITQAIWKFSTATANGVDVSLLLQSCQKDNTLSFQANGNGTIDEGATKCNPGDPQSAPFTWSFQNNETSIHASTVWFTGGSGDFTLVSLSETQLVVSQNITIGGNSQNVVVTFTH